MKIMLRALMALVLLNLSVTVSAHPHVFMDAQYRLQVNTLSIDSLEATWLFDLFTSTSLVLEYDQNADGQLQGEEKKALAEVMQSFETFGYFLKIYQAEQAIVPSQVDIVDIRIVDQQIWVRLGISLAEKISLKTAPLSLAFGDDELYFALTPPPMGNLLRLEGVLAELCTPTSRDAEELAIDSWVDVSCD